MFSMLTCLESENLLSHFVVIYVYIYAHPKFKIDAKHDGWEHQSPGYVEYLL